MEVELAIRNHGLPDQWPSPWSVLPVRSQKRCHQGRVKGVNLRHLPFVTIDGEDAGADDAVYCKKDLVAGSFGLPLLM